jgi:hypothetical protein
MSRVDYVRQALSKSSTVMGYCVEESIEIMCATLSLFP